MGSTLTVQSLHATYTTTLDTDGYNLSCTGKVTSGVRGIIDFGEGEHQFGDSFDYSAGAAHTVTFNITIADVGSVLAAAVATANARNWTVVGLTLT